jgi:hypothetical protein
MPRDPVDKKRPARYYRGLSEADKRRRKAEFERRKRADGFIMQHTDEVARPHMKRSKWSARFKHYYPELVGASHTKIGHTLHIPRRVLDEVMTKGIAAWKTSGSRPGATPTAWGVARVHKFIVVLQRLRGALDGLAAGSRYADAPSHDPDEYLRDGLY